MTQLRGVARRVDQMETVPFQPSAQAIGESDPGLGDTPARLDRFDLFAQRLAEHDPVHLAVNLAGPSWHI